MTRSRVKNDFSTGIDDNADVTAITIHSNENVGIGGSPTSSSSYRTLNIIGGADVGGALRLSTTANENGHVFQYNAGIYLSGDEVTFISTGDPGVGGDVKTAYRVDRTAELHRWFNPLDGSTEAMRINDAGQLLIGTSSNALDGNISGVGTSSNFTVNGSVGKFQVANTGNLIAFSRNAANYISATGTAAAIILDTNRTIIRSEAGSEYARFDVDGLKFNGDLSAANALDDYEEGTWTPTITVTEGPAAGASPSYSGTYTKIGNRVYATCTINLGNSGDAFAVDDRLSCGGLPFTSQRSTISGVGTGWAYSVFSSGQNCFWHVGIGTGSAWWAYCTHLDGTVAGNKVIELEFSYPTAQ